MLSITFTLALGKIDESQPGGSNTDAASALFVLIITCLCVFAICIVVVALLQMYEKLMRRSNALKHWQTVRRSEIVQRLLKHWQTVRRSDVQHFSEEDGQHEENEHNDRSKVADNGAGSGIEMQVISTSTAARKSDGDHGAGLQVPTEKETVDDGSDLPTLPDKPVWDEHEVLPDFDAPEPQAMERVGPNAQWRVLSSTPITKLKAAQVRHVDV